MPRDLGTRREVPVSPCAGLSIVVVTWHSADDVGALLASATDALADGAELVVVENASGDATPAIVRARVPDARVVENARNLGFAAAANVGLAASTRPYVLFLNPDATLHPDALPRALAHLASDPTIGVLGCRTLNPDGTLQPTVDRFHSVGALVREALVARRGPAAPPRGASPAATSDVDWVYGSFLLCRRAALAAVGGFDEAYEMYGEDIDLCHRVRGAGWRVVYFADATITHRGNRSGARRFGERRDVEVLKGTLRFFRRRRGRPAELAFRAAAGASFAWKALAIAAHDPARARLYRDMAWLCATGDPAARSDPAPRSDPPAPAGERGS